MNREGWLDIASKHMQEWVEDCADASVFQPPLISVGWPKGHRGKSHAIGQCWDKKTSGDKVRAHIFISPEQTDPIEVLAILLHELVHASVGNACGHRKEFRKVALELGLEPPMTATTPSIDLVEVLTVLAKEIGEYPHPGLTHKKRKVGSRLLKVKCWDCGCIVRMTRMWLDRVGPPRCGCGGYGSMEED